eukprot:6459896-Amphidinium_carterae.1
MGKSDADAKKGKEKAPLKLMDQPTKLSTVKTRKRPEKQLSAEEQTSTSIYDNLAQHLSNFEIYSLKINGETAQEKILRLKRENQKEPGKHVMGKIFWDQLRQEYTSSERTENMLKYPEGSTCSAQLQELASWLYKTPPNRQKLLSYLDRTVALNKTDSIAMMRLLCTQNLRRPDPYKLSLAIMRILVRTKASGVDLKHEELLMHSKFDSVLVQAHCSQTIPHGRIKHSSCKNMI